MHVAFGSQSLIIIFYSFIPPALQFIAWSNISTFFTRNLIFGATSAFFPRHCFQCGRHLMTSSPVFRSALEALSQLAEKQRIFVSAFSVHQESLLKKKAACLQFLSLFYDFAKQRRLQAVSVSKQVTVVIVRFAHKPGACCNCILQ